MKIRTKLLIWIILVTSTVLLISLGYITNKLKNITLSDALKLADSQSREYSNSIRSSLSLELGMARAMAHGFTQFRSIPQSKREETTQQFLKSVSTQNPNFLSVWVSWELYVLDTNWEKPYGRKSLNYFMENGKLVYSYEYKNLDGDTEGSSYYLIKKSKKETIVDPYWYTYIGSNKPVLETSVCVPVIDGERFAGLFGFDFELTRYQELVQKINPFEGSFAMLLSQNSTIVGHTNPELVGLPFDSIYPIDNKLYSVKENVYNGKDFSFSSAIGSTNKEYYATFSSIKTGESNTPWSLAIFVPTESLMKESISIAKKSYYVIFIGLIIIIVVVWIIAYSFTNPIVNITKVLREMALGKIDINKNVNITTGDEVEDISNSVNTLIEGLSKTVSFAKEIGRGNLNTPYTKLSEGDVLGEALLDMRKSLEHAKIQEDYRKQEDDKIKWANHGIAKFAELLRQNTDDMNEFSYLVISNLVKYINATIGGLFLRNDDNKSDIHFEMAACYAYEKKKYIQKRVNIGEGLISRCAQEGETIHLTELPKDYIQIVSGLGDDDPTSLLIVPLKLNDEVYGVIEIASFDLIEKHTIEFVEKIGESIAATISNIKINIRTIKLLDESRVKSEELSSQEEEMRQNMEELQATQEEAARKSAEMESLINALHASSYVIEYDTSGKIISVNDAYLELTGHTAKEIIGSHHADNLQLTEKQKKEYQKFWVDLKNGSIRKETNKVKLGGKTYTFIETYSPIFNENREVVKILKIAHNITDFISEKKEKDKR